MVTFCHGFLQVLQHVRLPLCHPKFIVNTVSEEILIKGDQESRDLVDEAKNYLLLPLDRSNMQGPRTRPRKPVRWREILYAGTLILPKSVFQFFLSRRLVQW